MVERKRRRKNKVRGERTHGMGGTKNNRGGGCRGGRGNAGANKHKFHSLKRLYPKKIRLNAKPIKEKIISLGDLNKKLDKMLKDGRAGKKGAIIVIGEDSGYTKVLSGGNIDKKIILKIKASEKAVEKIISAGGKVETEGAKTKMSSDSEDEDEELEFESKEEFGKGEES
ncbi:MAG: uL15 family ribosomal protein [Candidatus Diapherotrites archaeon]|nr:uL15 family ribosomal protein [Candidatus Diapherotrites archaeon]